MRAIQVAQYGGSEVLELREIDDPVPGPGEVVVDVAASGLNFIDVYHRIGRYSTPLPFILGSEGAGTVAAVGPHVTEFRAGDRVGWVNVLGSHAEKALVPADRLVRLPDERSAESAAASLLQGMTAHYLVRSTYPVRPGEAVLVHAAAGGMGQLLTQLVTHLGGRVIATASTPEKRDQAKAAGAELVVGYEDAADAARDFTDGVGVAVAYDGVGASTFESTLASLRPRGYLVSYGSASGPVPPVDPLRLASAGSLFLTRPSLGHYIAARAELLERAEDVLRWVADGTLTIHVTARYPLEQTRAALDALQNRRTTGKVIVVP